LETPEWLEALGPRSKAERPFTAFERKHERRGQPPRIWHVEVRYRQWDAEAALVGGLREGQRPSLLSRAVCSVDGPCGTIYA
jgi:hypothetical protein